MADLTICAITLCYNESRILPFYLRHYAPLVDRMVFFDGGSTDSTREIIAQCYQAEIYEHDTGGKVNDPANAWLKSNAWQWFDADWYIVVDCDEFLYHPDLRQFLADCDVHGYSLVQCEAWNMIGDVIPPDGLLTDAIRYGVRDDYTKKYFDKVCIFKASAGIQFNEGAHSFKVDRGARLAPSLPVKLLHYKWLSRADVGRKVATVKLSDANVAGKFGYEDDGITPSPQAWVARYDSWVKQRVKVL